MQPPVLRLLLDGLGPVRPQNAPADHMRTQHSIDFMKSEHPGRSGVYSSSALLCVLHSKHTNAINAHLASCAAL